MLRYITLSLAVVSLGLTAPLCAQSRSTVTIAELDAAVEARPIGNREAVREFLTTDQVQVVASQMGISTADLSAQVGSLDEASLDLLVQQIRDGEPDLAGGDQKVVISTTVALLVVIIIILLAS